MLLPQTARGHTEDHGSNRKCGLLTQETKRSLETHLFLTLLLFFTQISGRKFLPELCGEILKLPSVFRAKPQARKPEISGFHKMPSPLPPPKNPSPAPPGFWECVGMHGALERCVGARFVAVIARNSAMGINFVRLNRRDNPYSLATLDRKAIAHLEALNLSQNFAGSGKNRRCNRWLQGTLTEGCF